MNVSEHDRGNDTPFLEIDFTPNMSLVTLVRRFISDFYQRLLGDADAVSRVALATHELLENAVKYSVDGATRLRIRIDRGPTGRTIEIQTSNRSERHHIDAIEQFFVEFRAAADAEEFYVDLLRKCVHKTEGSGLGLARIQAEGEMNLSYHLENGELMLVAKGLVPFGGNPS